MSLVRISSNAFWVLRIVSEIEETSYYGICSDKILKEVIALDKSSFQDAFILLKNANYIHHVTNADVGYSYVTTSEGQIFFRNEMTKRVPLSFDAEKIARYLYYKLPLMHISVHDIKQNMFDHSNRDQCERGIIELVDEGYAVYRQIPIPAVDYLRHAHSNDYDYFDRNKVVSLNAIGRKAIRDNFILQKPKGEIAEMEDKVIEVRLGDGSTFHNSNIIIAERIQNSFNKAASSKVSDELKGLLEKLAGEVGKMSEVLSDDIAEETAKDLEILTSEATSKQPRRRWWELSMEGLRQAAKNAGEIGIPVTKTAIQIAQLLSDISTN